MNNKNSKDNNKKWLNNRMHYRSIRIYNSSRTLIKDSKIHKLLKPSQDNCLN